jgi:hypothetical protein
MGNEQKLFESPVVVVVTFGTFQKVLCKTIVDVTQVGPRPVILHVQTIYLGYCGDAEVCVDVEVLIKINSG